MADQADIKPSTTPAASKPTPDTVADASDSDLSGLEDEDDATLAALQSSRLSELQSAAAARASAPTSSTPFSSLRPFSSEKTAMHTIAAAPLAVLVFVHPDFPLCKVMAEHLDRIAGLYAQAGASTANEDAENVVWISLEAEEAKFLTDRLKVRVLPCVVGYRKGEECGRLVGFEGMRKKAQRVDGWKDVAGVLRGWGVLGKALMNGEEDGSDDDEEDEADVGGEARDGGRQSNWIGGQKSNSRFSTRGTGSRGADDADDDDWD